MIYSSHEHTERLLSSRYSAPPRLQRPHQRYPQRRNLNEDVSCSLDKIACGVMCPLTHLVQQKGDLHTQALTTEVRNSARPSFSCNTIRHFKLQPTHIDGGLWQGLSCGIIWLCQTSRTDKPKIWCKIQVGKTFHWQVELFYIYEQFPPLHLLSLSASAL